MIKIRGKIEQWSFTRYNDHNKCPYKAGLKHVMKMKEPSSPQAERGIDVHRLGEDYLNKKLKRPPHEFGSFKEDLEVLRANKAVAEPSWSFNAKWKPTGVFAKDVWCRNKIDAYMLSKDQKTATVVDFKTGKQRDEHQLQLGLYALAGFINLPDAEEIRIELWYLDQDHIEESSYFTSDFPKLKAAWKKRVQPMLTDTAFKPKPDPRKCRYCAFNKDNGGPCRY